MDPFIGEIKSVGFSFAPTGYGLCQGQLMPIQQNQALFALLGITFGGNGTSTFGLPNLSGRVPVGQGQLPGGDVYERGETGGVEHASLTNAQLPVHTHTAITSVTPNIANLTATTTIHAVTSPAATSAVPTGNFLTVGVTGGTTPTAIKPYGASGTDTTMASGMAVTSLSGSVTATAQTAINTAGGSLPVSLLQPYLVVTYIIAFVGIFPTRN
jgi:microcystin-dependent protein